MIAAMVTFGALVSSGASGAGDRAGNTWEGTWNTDFGVMTLDAGGSGSYEGFSPGTISGNVTGNVNEGTWEQPGDPPRKGTFRFTMSASGQSFDGDWAYDGGGCGSACGWDGYCTAGACLKNGIGDGDDDDGVLGCGDNYAEGKYVGETSQGQKVRFKFKNCKVKLPTWEIARKGEYCDQVWQIDGRGFVSRSGHFLVGSGEWDFNGKFVKKDKVKGSIQHQNSDPYCGGPHYTAHLKG